MLRDGLKSCNSWKGRAFLVNDFYQLSRLDSSLEPLWIHGAYEIVKNYINDTLKKEQIKLFYEIVNSHELPDGFEVPSIPNVPSSPVRVMHEGWKIGSPTWVFMGRNKPGCSQSISKDWVAVQRTVPENMWKNFDPDIPKTVWIAYNINKQMYNLENLENSTTDCIGPAFDFDELVKAVKKQELQF